MRRRLYDFFGLPSLPDVPLLEPDPSDALFEAEIDADLLEEMGPPIEIPRPVRAVDDTPVQQLEFHDLGEKRWLEWARGQQGLPRRGLRYIRPDEMHRLPLEGIAARLHQGDVCLVDLAPLAHMDSQRAALARQVQDVSARMGLPVFALDESQRLLLLPGRGSRVDTETHALGA